MADARQLFTEAIHPDPAHRGLDNATRAAKEAVRDIAKNGPLQRVTEELT
ncbi:MAG: hypothetical protein ACTHZN_03825 [Canibacter sp.]